MNPQGASKASSNISTNPSRRKLLQTATASAATFAALGSNFAWAQASDEIKVGVIGAGGRASGAVGDHMKASGITGVKSKIVSVCDMFPQQAKGLAGKHGVQEDKIFSGLDGYKAVIDSGVDLIITATPPGFRPIHFEAAVQAGKHVFFEKPVAVDPAGVRKVIAASKLAAEKKLAVVTGTQRRHEQGYMDTVKAIHDGIIGEILHMSVYWCGSGIWNRQRRPGMTDIEAQIHNWYHHCWLSGDQIVEQHIHNIDVANWVMNAHPISCFASGGRQSRKEPGDIWDNITTEFEYPNGGRVVSHARHWPSPADGNVGEFALGSKGSANPSGSISIRGGEKKSFRKQGAENPYVQEHVDLLNSIKAGKPLNEGIQIAESTLTAIMARMSAYTGKKVSWDFALNQSKLDMMPKDITKDTPAPPVEVPEPGKTKLI